MPPVYPWSGPSPASGGATRCPPALGLLTAAEHPGREDAIEHGAEHGGACGCWTAFSERSSRTSCLIPSPRPRRWTPVADRLLRRSRFQLLLCGEPRGPEAGRGRADRGLPSQDPSFPNLMRSISGAAFPRSGGPAGRQHASPNDSVRGPSRTSGLRRVRRAHVPLPGAPGGGATYPMAGLWTSSWSRPETPGPRLRVAR